MPSELIDSRSESDQETASTSYGYGVWAHFPAVIAFGIVFSILSGYPWRMYVALDICYTIYVFFFAIGSVAKDLDDVFGSPDIMRAVAPLFLPHLVALASLTGATALWFHLNAIGPAWLTEGHRGSLFARLGWIALALAGVKQGIWMSRRLKHQLRAHRS